MAYQALEIIRDSAVNSFLQVTVFVGALLLLFGYINHKTAGQMIAAIQRHRRWQPVIGALLGATPGCGGAIFVMPLYLRRVITFGTICSTLVATMGDSAFVVISRMPLQALHIHLISFAAAIVTGYVVDALGIGVLPVAEEDADIVGSDHPALDCPDGHPWADIGHRHGDEVEQALHTRPEGFEQGIGYRFQHRAYPLFWAVCGIGGVLGVIMLVRENAWLTLGDFPLSLVLGLIGTGLCIVWTVATGHLLADDSHEETEEKLSSLRETFIHNADETAFVGFWVFVAYTVYELVVTLGHIDIEGWIQAGGVLAVIVAACIGLIPGCGPQVILVSMYTQGIIPFSAVLANAISQDGDALFPILAMDRKVALHATVITTIPALIIGVIAYYIEQALQ